MGPEFARLARTRDLRPHVERDDDGRHRGEGLHLLGYSSGAAPVEQRVPPAQEVQFGDDDGDAVGLTRYLAYGVAHRAGDALGRAVPDMEREPGQPEIHPGGRQPAGLLGIDRYVKGQRVAAGEPGHEVEGGKDAAVDGRHQEDDHLPSRQSELERAPGPAHGPPLRRHSTW